MTCLSFLETGSTTCQVQRLGWVEQGIKGGMMKKSKGGIYVGDTPLSVGFGLWCLCTFFVCCDKRGRRSISKQYTYNKEQREVEKVGGENREENMRSCDSLGFSLSGISRSGFSVLLASFSLHWGTLIPFPAAPISHTLRTLFPTQPQNPSSCYVCHFRMQRMSFKMAHAMLPQVPNRTCAPPPFCSV